MSEKLIFGVLVPVVIFAISVIATYLIYRRFSRQPGGPAPAKGQEKK